MPRLTGHFEEEPQGPTGEVPVPRLLRSTAAALAAAGCISSAAEARLAIRRLTRAAGATASSRVDAEGAALVAGYVERRRQGEPPHYILGGCEFMGRWLQLDRGAYIPRPWTETMVRRGIAGLRNAPAPAVAVDVGTGCGAIAAAVATAVPASEVWALDLDVEAIRWARLNCAWAGNVRVEVSDLFAGLPGGLVGTVALVIGSLPYVPRGEMGGLLRDYRDHEPEVALDGGEDGLEVNLRALREARSWLRGGGRVMLELGQGQGAPLALAARAAGYRRVTVHGDEDGDDVFIDCRA